MPTRLLSLIALSLFLATVASASTAAKPGTIDRSWGDRGLNRVLPGRSGDGYLDEPRADAVVLSHGRVLLLTDELNDAYSLENLFAFGADGQLDRSFGTQGRIKPPVESDAGRFVGFLPNGKIFTRAGERFSRLNANGTPDKSFGDRGSMRLVVDGCAYRPVVAEPGRGGLLYVSVIVCLGSPSTPENTWRVIRLLPSGRIDTSYGKHGLASVSIGNVADPGVRTFASFLLPQPDGSVILAGRALGPGGFDDERAGFARLRADGTVDRSFGSNGTGVFSKAFQLLNSVRPAPGGGIVAVGCELSFGAGPAVVGRFDGKLAPMTSWDATGLRSFDVPDRDYTCASFAAAPDGKLVFVGSDHVTRLLANGVPDPSFGSHGSVALPRGTYAFGAVQPDRKILVAGSVAVPAHTTRRTVQILRLNG